MMRGPPLAPSTARRLPAESVTMMGDMEDCGRLPGRMKLAGEGGRPYLQCGLPCSQRDKRPKPLEQAPPFLPGMQPLAAYARAVRRRSSVPIGLAGGGEVVHLVVQDDACAPCMHTAVLSNQHHSQKPPFCNASQAGETGKTGASAPVLLDMTREPKPVLMVVVKETALCSESTTARWLVPWSTALPWMVQSPPYALAFGFTAWSEIMSLRAH